MGDEKGARAVSMTLIDSFGFARRFCFFRRAGIYYVSLLFKIWSEIGSIGGVWRWARAPDVIGSSKFTVWALHSSWFQWQWRTRS